MSKLKNAPLVEVVFEIKWGKTTRKGNELLIEFSQKEQSLMPGKFQIYAESEGFGLLEVIENQPPFPHLVKYRYRKKQESYPLYQLGDGVYTINQANFGEFVYDWDTFKIDVQRGIKLLEKSYPFPIKDLPLIDIQLRYRDVIPSENNESIFDFINNKLNIGNISLPKKLVESQNVKTDCPLGSITLEVECDTPRGQIICQINQGTHNGEKVFVIDFIVTSKAHVFVEISYDSLISWCSNAHNHHKVIFKAICNEKFMETFV